MYEFWYDYMKPKYVEKVKLCYVDTGGFIAYIKMDDSFKDITEDVEARFDTSNYELDHYRKEKNNWINEKVKK